MWFYNLNSSLIGVPIIIVCIGCKTKQNAKADSDDKYRHKANVFIISGTD